MSSYDFLELSYELFSYANDFFWKKIYDFMICQSLTKKVKVDQKSQRLTKNGQMFD